MVAFDVDDRNVYQGVPLLTKPTAFDEEAINEEFREDFKLLEEEAIGLDIEFQNLVKDLRIWIAASVSPVTEEAKVKSVPNTAPNTSSIDSTT